MTAALAAPGTLVDGEVSLVPLDAGVAALLVAASHDSEITRWTQVPENMSLLDAGLVAAGWASNPSVVRLQVDAGRLGRAGMVTVWITSTGEAEVGYWLLEAARGRGIARRAVRMLCDWTFATSELDHLRLTVLPGNRASERVAAACGFRPAGSVERDVKGHLREVSLWVLARADQRPSIGT